MLVGHSIVPCLSYSAKIISILCQARSSMSANRSYCAEHFNSDSLPTAMENITQA